MSEVGDRPLMSLALFAYNQEKYIREAVESVLNQDYSPLEIILSDDCSSDKTYDIMKEMSAAYTGQHKVVVRKSGLNVGTARHVQEAFDASTGLLFIVAAGDDISLPGRVSALVAAWDCAGRPSGVIHSGWEAFREGEAKPVGKFPPKKSVFAENILEGYAHSQWLPAAAPTVAYTRDVFDKFRPLYGGSIIEDAPLFLRAALIGKFVPCDEVLVRLRKHDDNSGTGHTADSVARWNRFMQSKLIAFRNMQADLAGWQGNIDLTLRIRIERRILMVLHSVSNLFLPQTASLGELQKLGFFFRMIAAPAVASTFRLRVEYALSFFGFTFHLSIKNVLHRLLLRFGYVRS